MLSASPSTPIESGWRVHISGVAIERYWWMRAMIVGCVSSSPPFGFVGSSGGSPSAMRVALPPEQVADLVARRSRRAAPCAAPSAASSAGGRTGSRTRRRSAPAASAGRSRAGRSALHVEVSKKTPGMPAKREVRFAMSAIPACAMISCTPAQRSTSACRSRRDRRQPAAAVDEDRHVALGRELEHRRAAARPRARSSARADAA